VAKSSASGSAAVEEPKPRRARATRGMAGPARRRGRGSAPERAARSGREEANKVRRRGQRPAAMGAAPSPFGFDFFGRPARGGEEWPEPGGWAERGRRER
jgi:hypothetical protein